MEMPTTTFHHQHQQRQYDHDDYSGRQNDGDILSATPWEISSLSDTQEKIISLLPVVSGCLSVMGSCTIIYMATTASRRRTRNNDEGETRTTSRARYSPCWTPYTRLLFGMSCCDIIVSTAQMFMPFLLPAETSQRIWAIGNDTTCSVMGFFQQLSLSAFLYNACLSIYFVLTARYGWKHPQLAKSFVEPCLHILSIGYPLATAISGAIMGIYHEMELGQTCWITNYPENCEHDDNVDCKDYQIAWIFGGSVLLFSFVSIPINNMIILLFVRKQTIMISKKRRRRRRQQQRGRLRGSSSLQKRSGDSNSMVTSAASGEEKSMTCSAAGRIEHHSLPGSINDISTAAAAQEEDEQDDEEHPDSSHNKNNEDEQLTRSREEKQFQRLQLVASQAFLYVGAFFLTTIWTFILRIMESLSYNAEDEARIFPLLVLQAWFLPLQGFFNVFIYIRPKYLKHRQQYPNESTLWALRCIVYKDEEPIHRHDHRHQANNNNNNNNEQQGGMALGRPKKQPAFRIGVAITTRQQYQQQQEVSSIVDLEANHNDRTKQQTLVQQQSQQPLFPSGDDNSNYPATAGGRPLPRNNNNGNNYMSSITCDDGLLDDDDDQAEPSSSSIMRDGDDEEDEDIVVKVKLQSEWRWNSGSGSGSGSAYSNSCTTSAGRLSASLETISELSAVSFVDDTPPERDHQSPSKQQNDESSTMSMKSSPAWFHEVGKRHLFAANDDNNKKHNNNHPSSSPVLLAPTASQEQRRWSTGSPSLPTTTTTTHTNSSSNILRRHFPTTTPVVLANCIQSVLLDTLSIDGTRSSSQRKDDKNDDKNGANGSVPSVDPSFDRMGSSIKTGSTKEDSPMQRPTRRPSPTTKSLKQSTTASTTSTTSLVAMHPGSFTWERS